MAMKQLFTNNAVSLLVGGISSTATSLTVMAGHGAMFPQPGPNEFFTVTLEDQAATIREIVWVIARSGDVFTIQRGVEGTTPQAWAATSGADTLVDHRVTAMTLARTANTYAHTGFPALTNFQEAIDYLLVGTSISGGQVVDATVTTQISGAQTIISLPSAYTPGTTAVYIGGLRQKRGIDFIEVGPTELRLQYILTPTRIAGGENVVVDYVVA